MRIALHTVWTHPLRFAKQQLFAWTRPKHSEGLPIVLHRRRIYVLPSRFGFMFALILLAMLIGALNYNNNPAMLLTCLLGASALQSMFTGFRSLHRMELHTLQAQPCSAGESLQLSLRFHSGTRARCGLHLRAQENASSSDSGSDGIVFDIPTGDLRTVAVEIPAPRRGWQPIGRIRVWTEYPFGLFHVWSWLQPDFRALIYPHAEVDAPALPGSEHREQPRTQRQGDDELGLLRDYHPSDPRRTIAWKASARHDQLLVKEFEQHRGRDIVLDWHALDGLDAEARISRLTAWVERAEAARLPYRLELPQLSLGAGLGVEHRNRCLRELALLPAAR